MVSFGYDGLPAYDDRLKVFVLGMEALAGYMNIRAVASIQATLVRQVTCCSIGYIPNILDFRSRYKAALWEERRPISVYA